MPTIHQMITTPVGILFTNFVFGFIYSIFGTASVAIVKYKFPQVRGNTPFKILAFILAPVVIPVTIITCVVMDCMKILSED